MSDQHFIRIERVSKHFGPVRAVDEVAIEIARGEFFALLGPSGCGKTTLLRMLGGFEIPTRGEIFIDGEPMAAVPAYLRPVNMVFQNYAIFPHLNVFQNIAFGLRKDRLSKAEITRRVEEALAMIRLEGYGARAAHELSGGQRQRIALARALIKKPKVLLLDEPLGALDKKLREQMQLELRDLQRSIGITFVFVTHDQEEALTMADRVAVMAAGKVLEEGAPADLYSRPRTRFVAEFLGAMNITEGRVRGHRSGSAVVDTDSLGQITLPAGKHDLAVGDKVTIGLRPENIRFEPKGKRSPAGSVCGHIGASAFLGDRTHFYVTVEGASAPLQVSVQNLADLATAVGGARTEIRLTWTPKALLLLRDK